MMIRSMVYDDTEYGIESIMIVPLSTVILALFVIKGPYKCVERVRSMRYGDTKNGDTGYGI